jgi:STE24 endopeptidase
MGRAIHPGIRATETEAGLFGLNAAHEPHGFASVTMRPATCRKLEPSPLEEFVFYDQPSGRARVRTAMTWAAKNSASAR